MRLIGISKTEFKITNQKWLQINNIILEIEKAINLEHLRLSFLEQISLIIPHAKSFFDLGYLKQGNAVFFDARSTNMTENELNDYYKQYQSSDYIAWMLSGDGPVYYRDSQLISDDLRQKSAFYQNWLKPLGVYYSIGSSLFDHETLYGSVTLFRSHENDFSDEDVYILRILSEHLTAKLSSMYPQGIRKPDTIESDSSFPEKYQLTSRENEIINLINHGLSNKEIAQKLCISESTVKKHNYSIFSKLNVHTRTQLIKLFSSEQNATRDY